MEYTLKKEKCRICETDFEGASEQPVDIELSLPDYCPDIERILKCRICPGITSGVITGDRLDVDGNVTVRLYYLDSKKQAVRLCEHTRPFSCSFTLKSAQPDRFCRVRLRTEYLNCRAVSPRKLDIHGAFSVLAKVCRAEEKQYCTSIDGSDIEQQCHSEKISTLKGCANQQFTLSEVLDIGKGKGSPEMILRSELNYIPDDSRAIENKLMLKGEAVLKVLYITDIESGSQDTMSFNIPVSQIIDVPGIDEGTVNDISVDVMSYDISLKSEFDEGSTLLNLDARLCACVRAFEDREIVIIDDAYSTEYELETGYRTESFMRLASLCDMTQSITGNINTDGSGITRVIDLWCESISSIADNDSGKISIRGKMNLCMLALDSEGVPFCTDKTVDFSFVPDEADSDCKPSVRTDLCVSGISFRITDDNNVEFKVDLRLSGAVYESRSVRCINDASANEEKRREKDKTAALTIYYADKNESLWDIARRYCTSVEAVRLENSLTDDIIQARSMVLIPMQ